MLPSGLDETDRRLLSILRSRPRAGVSELARRLDLARGTVTARLDALTARKVVTGFGPDVDPAAAGYDVVAFTTLAIAQGEHDEVIQRLLRISEIMEVHTVTGRGDLLVKIVAVGNQHLHRVLQEIASIPQVTTTETQLALATPVQRSVADLITAELGGD